MRCRPGLAGVGCVCVCVCGGEGGGGSGRGVEWLEEEEEEEEVYCGAVGGKLEQWWHHCTLSACPHVL